MMTNFPRRTIRDIDVRGKIVLLRTDYNLPIQDGNISDDWRLSTSLPTLRYLTERGARVVIISHLGRPGGRTDQKLSLGPVAQKLSKLLNKQIRFVNDCIGDKVKVATRSLAAGEILMLENLRFHSGEEANESTFAQQLVKSSGADYFVQDGFGVIHRAHASTSAITEFIPSVAGLLLESEWLAVENAIDNPNRPLVVVLGGAKIADKLPLIDRFIDIADQIIIAGAVANNFLVASGFPVGASLWEPDVDIETAKIIEKAKKQYAERLRQRFILPVDVAVSRNGNVDGARYVVARGKVAPNNQIFDIGTKSINQMAEIIGRAGTVVWNGPLGMTEKPNFAHASSRLALALANNPQIYSLICGGDTVDFVRDWDALRGASFSHFSTGGGSSLALMVGQPLPGLDSLLS